MKYSDGNTYTANLTLEQALNFQRIQNGGTVSMSNAELARLLRSAASALEHGRNYSAVRKLRAIARELSTGNLAVQS